MKSTGTRLKANESGSYDDFKLRQGMRMLAQGRSEQDVVDYWNHLDEKPGVRTAIETPVTVSNQEQGISDVPSLLGVPAHFVQGVTFNFGDEAIGTMYGLLAPGVTTQQGRDDYRAMLQNFQQNNPGQTIAAQIAGGVALGVATGGTALAAGARGVPGALAGGAIGAGASALAGAGAATGPVGTRVQAATQPGPLVAGALGGALAGPVLRGATRAVGATARAGKKVAGAVSGRVGQTIDQLADLLPGSPVRQARSMLRQALEADGISPSQALAAANSRIARGLPTTVGDIGGSHTGALVTNAQMYQGPVQQAFSTAVRNRQVQADPRALSALGRQLRAGAQNAYEAVDQLAAQQKTLSDPLYEQAYQMSVTVGPKIRAMLELPEFRRAYDVGRSLSLMDDAGGVSRGLPIPDLADDIPESLPVRALDYIKKGIQHLQTVVSAEGKSAVSHEQARSMGRVINNALGEIDEQVPIYAQARSIWRGFSDQMDAVASGYGGQVERGQLVPRGAPSFLSKPVAEIRRELAELTPEQLPFYRMGVLQGLADALHGPGAEAAETVASLNAKRLFGDRTLIEKIGLLFDDPSAAREFTDRIAGEAAWLRMAHAGRPRSPSPTTATNRLLPQGVVGRTASRMGAPRNISRGQMLGDEIVGLYMKGLEDPNELLAMLQSLANVGRVEAGALTGARVAAGQQTR